MKLRITVGCLAVAASFANPAFAQLENDPARKELLERSMRRSNPDYFMRSDSSSPMRSDSSSPEESITSPAFAQGYVGGSIGQTTIQDFCDGIPGSVSCDEESTSWKIFGGYQFNRNFALEFGYVDLGEGTLSGPGGTAVVEATAFELVAIGLLPLANNFSLYGKFGLYYAETEASVNTFTLRGNAEESNTDLTFGIGAQFDVSKQFAIRAEWQRYQEVADTDTDVDVVSIGALFRF